VTATENLLAGARKFPQSAALCVKESVVEEFREIVNAILEGVSTSEATYVDARGVGDSQKVQGVSLAFDLGWFVIENPFTVIGANKSHIALKVLIGDRVKSAHYDENEIQIIFDSGGKITVSMKDEDFTGPEAASYSPKQGEIIVFN
jgi:hypothetical protein